MIADKECVSQHGLVVGDVMISVQLIRKGRSRPTSKIEMMEIDKDQHKSEEFVMVV